MAKHTHTTLSYKYLMLCFVSLISVFLLSFTSLFHGEGITNNPTPTQTPITIDSLNQEPSPSHANESINSSQNIPDRQVGSIQAVVVRSWGPCSSSDLLWVQLNSDWSNYGSIPIDIDYANTHLCEGEITYASLAASGADVVILSDPAGGTQQYSPDEIAALTKYAQEGHNIIGTYLAFQWGDFDNRGLRSLFGISGSSTFINTTQVSVVPTYNLLESDNPLFSGMGTNYQSSGYPCTQVPSDSSWDAGDLAGARFVAMTSDNLASIIVYDEGNYHAIYISNMPEYYGSAADARFLYNAITYNTVPTTRYIVSGKVSNPEDAGIGGVTISDGRGHAVTTDGNGNYHLNELAGTYTLTATKDGLFFAPPSLEVVVSGDMAVNITGYPCIAPSGLHVCNLQPGDILLERSPTYAAVFSIGGTYFTHAAMYLGMVAAPGGGPETIMPRLAEGQGYTPVVQDQVWETDLTDHPFWSGNDLLDWAVVRPNFSDTVKNEAIQYIRGKAAAEGITFDIQASKWTGDKFYCSKLVWRSYLDVPGGRDLETNVGLGSSLLDWWVTPDDLYFSVIKGSKIVESKLGISLNRVLLTLWSPAHIMLVDPSGQRTGYDPVTRTILNEIPLSTYTVPPDAEVETISAIGVGDGWKVIVTGYDDGEYKLEYRYLEAGTRDMVTTGSTTPEQVDEYAMEDPIFGIYLPIIIH